MVRSIQPCSKVSGRRHSIWKISNFNTQINKKHGSTSSNHWFTFAGQALRAEQLSVRTKLCEQSRPYITVIKWFWVKPLYLDNVNIMKIPGDLIQYSMVCFVAMGATFSNCHMCRNFWTFDSEADQSKAFKARMWMCLLSLAKLITGDLW